MRVAKQAAGGKARLDCSGVLFLRSLCRLTHVGHAQYYKGILPIPASAPTLPIRYLSRVYALAQHGRGRASFSGFLRDALPWT